MKYIISYLLILTLPLALGFVSISKGHLEFNGQRLFLSGANTPWVAYGRDFGRGAYAKSRPQFEKWLAEIAAAGGNAVRVWVHIDGQWSPHFNAEGFATGDDVHSLIEELGQFIEFAEKHNIFTILCLWNLAVKPQHMLHLYSDESKLDSYINKVLKPLVAGLKHLKGLAAWDIINEPTGSVKQGIKDENPCWDTTSLEGSGADWTSTHLTMKEVLKFVNHHANAIKSVDAKALITVGEGEGAESKACAKCRDFYSDHCLHESGGKPKGTLDFYQFHSYVWKGKYSATSPMKNPFTFYKSDKPIIIGEFAVKCSESKNAEQCYTHAYNSGYSGILSWAYDGAGGCSDGHEADAGMKAIHHLKNHGVVALKIV